MLSTTLTTISTSLSHLSAKLNQLYFSVTHNFALATNTKTETNGGGGSAPDPTAGFNSIIDAIKTGLKAGGLIFIVIGGVQIATAIKAGEQNPEAITGAVKNILIGLFLEAIGWIVDLF